jgi:hypothetical protein
MVNVLEESKFLLLIHLYLLLNCQSVMANLLGISNLSPELLSRIFYASLWEGSTVLLDTKNAFLETKNLEICTKDNLQKTMHVP